MNKSSKRGARSAMLDDQRILSDPKAQIRALEAEVTRLKKLNEVLIESQNIQNTILEKSLVGYYIVAKGKFRVMNPMVISYTGYLPEELIGSNADFMIHPDDRRAVKENARAMLAGNLTMPYEFRIMTKQQETHWILEAVAPVLFEGKPAILGNSLDITQRKLTEQRLKESENLYRVIFETTGNSTVIIEEDKTISLVNSEFEKLTGYRKEDTEGKMKWPDLVAETDQPWMEEYHRLRRINPDAVPRTYEYHLMDSQGRVKNVLSITSLIPGTKKHVSSSIDITELKEAEKELIHKSIHLEELNSALRVLLKQREDDREELEKNLLSNMRDLVLPYLEKLRKNGMDKKSMVYVDLLTSNLEHILSPFSRKLSAQYLHLTPKEIQVANLIKDGKSSKEIANLLNISSSAIDVYRYRIRNKLGLNNQKANLRSYLLSLS